jgi:hypothetical protein
VAELPIISPHGHVHPRLLDNQPFADPAILFVTPDHHVTQSAASRAARAPAGWLCHLRGSSAPVNDACADQELVAAVLAHSRQLSQLRLSV